jgi:hypothetical protein
VHPDPLQSILVAAQAVVRGDDRDVAAVEFLIFSGVRAYHPVRFLLSSLDLYHSILAIRRGIAIKFSDSITTVRQILGILDKNVDFLLCS